MKLMINGEEREFRTGLSLVDLLQGLELDPQRVVIELNREILNTQEHLERQLVDGDKLELVQFVGGG